MFVSVLVNNTHMICNVGTTRSQETVSLQRQVELLLVQMDRERREAVKHAEEITKCERQRADAAEARAFAAELQAEHERTRADNEKARADAAEAQVQVLSKETQKAWHVKGEQMGIQWTNLALQYQNSQYSSLGRRLKAVLSRILHWNNSNEDGEENAPFVSANRRVRILLFYHYYIY